MFSIKRALSSFSFLRAVTFGRGIVESIWFSTISQQTLRRCGTSRPPSVRNSGILSCSPA